MSIIAGRSRLLAWASAGVAVAAVATLAALAAAGPAGAQPSLAGSPPDYEVWALDQGEDVNRIHVYGSDLTERAVIDVGADHGVETPHMVEFNSTYEYAVVASTSSGDVTIIRTADYEVVDVVETGPGAHMAHFTPDDASIWVANIGAQTFTEITADLDTETFEVDRELDVTTDPAWQDAYGDLDPAPAPVCHEYTADGDYAYLTLGPSSAVGALVVVDITADEPFIERAFDRDDVKANCGLALHPDGDVMYANWGDPADPDDPPAQSGQWYAFDTADHSLIDATDETGGIDAHGVRITPDGTELWQVNRGSDNGIVVDTGADPADGLEHAIVDDIDFTGDSPDILDFSPDGERAFVSLRGPNPLSGAAHVATGTTPGFAVIDVATRELDEDAGDGGIVQPGDDEFGDLPAEDDPRDFHGLAVRVVDDSLRLAGADRIGTAIDVSADQFADGSAEGAVVARSGDFADALAGTPLAAAVNGPLLLTPGDELHPDVAAELQRAVPETATVTVLGGEAALSDDVEQQIADLGFAGVDRLAGSTRFETAVAIAGALGDPDLQLLTTGVDFPDALTAGTAAAHADGAVLLTAGDTPHPATEAYLNANPGTQHAVGGPSAQAHPDAQAHVGATRFQTAVAVAEAFFDTPRIAGLARGDAFADALAGGAHAAAHDGPVLLTPSTSLHEQVGGYVCSHRQSIQRVVAYGGGAALADEVLGAAVDRRRGEGC